MTLVGENQVIERFITKDYVGHYECDGFNCNCSWFMRFRICRHILFVSKKNDLKFSGDFECTEMLANHDNGTQDEFKENIKLPVTYKVAKSPKLTKKEKYNQEVKLSIKMVIFKVKKLKHFT